MGHRWKSTPTEQVVCSKAFNRNVVAAVIIDRKQSECLHEKPFCFVFFILRRTRSCLCLARSPSSFPRTSQVSVVRGVLFYLSAELLRAPLFRVKGAASAHRRGVRQSRPLRDPESQGLHVPVGLQKLVDSIPVELENRLFFGAGGMKERRGAQPLESQAWYRKKGRQRRVEGMFPTIVHPILRTF